ncbi:hypothetical protein XENTR_v10002550 [Xenopus tropicalis]|nr:hypothetical protein XENTR_v10002550 [Xenopus tropicalis]
MASLNATSTPITDRYLGGSLEEWPRVPLINTCNNDSCWAKGLYLGRTLAETTVWNKIGPWPYLYTVNISINSSE